MSLFTKEKECATAMLIVNYDKQGIIKSVYNLDDFVIETNNVWEEFGERKNKITLEGTIQNSRTTQNDIDDIIRPNLNQNHSIIKRSENSIINDGRVPLFSDTPLKRCLPEKSGSDHSVLLIDPRPIEFNDLSSRKEYPCSWIPVCGSEWR